MAIIRYFIPFLAFITATFFVRFLGSEGSAIMTSSRLGIIGILLFAFIFLFHRFSKHLTKKYGSCLVLIIYRFFFFCVFFDFSLLRIYFISIFGHFCSDLLFGVLVWSVGGGQGLPLPAPSPSREADEEGMNILMSILLHSESQRGTSVEPGTSVNQPEAGPVNPGNPAASPGEEAGPANQRVVPYPYQPDEVIGESSGSEAHSEPSADSSSAPSALDQRKDELIQANLLQRKGDLAEGQEVAEVRQAVETDFGIDTKGAEFELIRQMEKEVGSSKNEECPATNSIFNEIKDHLGKHQDGRGGGKPSRA